MKTTIRKIGGSLGFTIPHAIVLELNIKPGDVISDIDKFVDFFSKKKENIDYEKIREIVREELERLKG